MGAGTSGIWGHREEAQRPLHETMRLAEARLGRHAPGGSMPSKTPKHCKVEEMRPKWPFWKHRAPKMRLAEAQCAHRKHCYPETPLGRSPHFSGLANFCRHQIKIPFACMLWKFTSFFFSCIWRLGFFAAKGLSVLLEQRKPKSQHAISELFRKLKTTIGTDVAAKL